MMLKLLMLLPLLVEPLLVEPLLVLPLMLLPLLVEGTRVCTYLDQVCSKNETCYGCRDRSTTSQPSASDSFEVKDDKLYYEVWSNINCSGDPTGSNVAFTTNTTVGTCYNTTYNTLFKPGGSIRFGNANSVGMSLIVMGLFLLLISLPLFN
eukprot:GHVR01125284.1.p1 GENE.GHVR01125284.1~~GHVR01125284.1.p1  ORF type:complete len:151 (-),score=9.24 GHVR01125284.1:435-887(-)